MAALQPPGTTWVDINTLLLRAREALPVGQLIHGEAFSLFEAMSAVEIGNPKMDAAAVPRSSSAPIVTPPTVQLGPDQILGVIDELAALEATWHCGASLAQTVYTCLFMLQPSANFASESPVLHAYCSALRATCLAVRWLILAGAVTEEEDMNIAAYGLPLSESGGGRGEADVQERQAACDLLDKAAATCETSGSSGEHAAAFKALAQRLRFRKALLVALGDLQQKSVEGLQAASGQLEAAASLLQQITAAPAAAEGAAGAPLPGFEPLVNQHLLGPAPPRVVKVMSQSEALSHFSTLVQQLQQAAAVVHVKGFRGLQQHVERFGNLKAGPVARSTMHYLVAGKAWAGALPVNMQQGPPSAPAPWTMDRPLVCEACALPVEPKAIGEEVDMFVEQAVIAAGNWCQATLLNPCRRRRRLRRGLEDWSHLYQHALNADMSPALAAYARAHGWKWEPPEDPVNEDPQGPLATWVEVQSAASCLGHLLLGFELELYQPREYAMVYWYCAHLYASQKGALQALIALEAPVVMPPAAAADAKAAASGKGKGAKGAAGRAAAAATAAAAAAQEAANRSRQQQLLLDGGFAELGYSLCQGLLRVMLALVHAGAVSDPKLPFNGASQLFDQRFAALHQLQRPDPLPFSTYEQSVDIGDMPLPQLLMLGADALAVANRTVPMLRGLVARCTAEADASAPGGVAPPHGLFSSGRDADLKALARVVMQNTLAASILARTLHEKAPEQAAQQEKKEEGQEDSASTGSTNNQQAPLVEGLAVTYDFSHHSYFPALGVKTGGAGAKKADAAKQ